LDVNSLSNKTLFTIIKSFTLKLYYLLEVNIKNSPFTSSILLAIFFSLGIPPYHYWVISLLALSCFLHLITKHQNILTKFLIIFLFLFTHYLTSSYWVINAFLLVIEHKISAIFLGSIALLLISLSMTIVTTLSLIIAIVISQKLKSSNLLLALIPLFWAFSEVIRSYFLGGQPMHYIGYMLGENDYLTQIASIYNVHIVSYFLVFTAILMSRGGIYIIYSIVVLCLGFIFGLYQLNNHTESNQSNLTLLKVRLVNLNLTQHQLANPENAYSTIEKYTKLSSKKTPNWTPSLIIWPESSLQFYITKNNKNNRKKITHFLNSNQSLIASGPRYIYEDNTIKYYNSIFHLNSTGNITDIYDKQVLVPWGEYIPYRKYFPEKLTDIFDVTDYSQGQSSSPINYHSLFQILPLLCAEGHYPSLLKQKLKNQSLIIMIGNESWFANTTEPHQYLINAKYRAIESGLPVLLNSNRGYLAVIDKKGIVKQSIYSDEPSTLDWNVPVELNK